MLTSYTIKISYFLLFLLIGVFLLFFNLLSFPAPAQAAPCHTYDSA
jgi:hypothetical protein